MKVTAFRCDKCGSVFDAVPGKGFRIDGDVYRVGEDTPTLTGQQDLCVKCSDKLLGDPEHRYALEGIAELVGCKGATPDVILEAVEDLKSSLNYHSSQPYPDDPAGEIY